MSYEEGEVIEQETVVQPQPTNGNGDQIGEANSVKSAVQAAREMIPVGPTGAQPMNFAQQVDYAKAMTQALNSIPPHLRGNVGDCLAVIDIASRAGLSPYMLAGKTYVQGGRLCFESQAYHALAQSSGLLQGDLHPEWIGDGDERVCVVTGYLKGDPRPKVLKSQPLKDLRPGTVVKDGKTFSKGSPLWLKKPDVQLFYDTARDWVRIYAPRATLGIYTPDEMIDHDINQPIEMRIEDSGLKARLAGKVGEGHQDGFAETELASLTATNRTIQPAASAPKESGPAIENSEPDSPRQPRSRKRTSKAATANAAVEDESPAEQEANPAPTTKAKKSTPTKITKPTTAKEYIAYAEAWIETEEEAAARWADEDEFRNELKVPIKERLRLLKMIKDKG